MWESNWSLEAWHFNKTIVSFFCLIFHLHYKYNIHTEQPFHFSYDKRPKKGGGIRKKGRGEGERKKENKREVSNQLLLLFSAFNAFLYYHSPHQTSFHGQCQWGTMLSLPGLTNRSCVPISSPASTSSGRDLGTHHLLFQYPRPSPPLAGNCAQLHRVDPSDSQSTEHEESHRIPCLEKTKIQKKF